MRRRLTKKLKDLLVQSKKPREPQTRSPDRRTPEKGPLKPWEPAALEKMPVSAELGANIRLLEEVFGQNTDFTVREFAVGPRKVPAALVYLSTTVERAQLDNFVLESLMLQYPEELPVTLAAVEQSAVTVAKVTRHSNFGEIAGALLDGEAVLFLTGETQALGLAVRDYQDRAITESMTESVVRGPRDAFVEDFRRNVMLIRRRLKTPNLVMERFEIGRETHTTVVLGYIKGLAPPQLVSEVRNRLRRIDIDAVFDSNYIEEMIVDNPLSPFPQALATERPDRVAAALVEGRVVLLTDTTPFALVLPTTLASLLQASEDYYHPFGISTVVRWLRYLAFFVSIAASPLYVAITTFHQEMIPFGLLLSIAVSREGVPLPAVLEALVMEATFELLREAGVRLPRPIGQAVSIVGALVIGDAAITAKVVSPLMVIVVATAGIASFATPSYELAIPMRLLRFPLIAAGGVLGLFGVTAGLLAIMIHLAGLRSFGQPYLAPLAPLKFTGLKDVLVRLPVWAMRTRPGTSKRDWHRVAPGLKPKPPEE
ncbi:MAG: spore germination protein [Bacillota bacterium]